MARGLLVGSGRYLNTLARGRVTANNESTAFPLVNLYDGDPGTSFQHTALTFVEVVCDGDLSLGTGDFEAAHVGGVPPDWTNESGSPATLVRDTSVKRSGASSLRLNGASGGIAQVSRIFYCQAGEELTVRVWMAGDVQVGLQDLETGAWLIPDTARANAYTWKYDTNFAALRHNSSHGFQNVAATFRVSDIVSWSDPYRRLKFTAFSAGVNGWLDDFDFYPSVDTLVVVGNNIRQSNVFRWETRQEPSHGWIGRADVTHSPTVFYCKLSQKYAHRYQRFYVEKNNIEPVWYGEIVSCQTALLSCAMTPVQTVHQDVRVEIPRLAGGRAARGLADWPNVTKRLAFQHDDRPDTAETGYWAEWYGEFGLRALGGAPMVLVPNTDRREVLYGVCSPAITETDGAPGQPGYKRVDAIDIQEFALPSEL